MPQYDLENNGKKELLVHRDKLSKEREMDCTRGEEEGNWTSLSRLLTVGLLFVKQIRCYCYETLPESDAQATQRSRSKAVQCVGK
jgi:hypothetical protein